MWHVIITAPAQRCQLTRYAKPLSASPIVISSCCRPAMRPIGPRCGTGTRAITSATSRRARFSVWGDYSEIAALPPWDVVGLEVVERDAFSPQGGRPGRRASDPDATGGVRQHPPVLTARWARSRAVTLDDEPVNDAH